MEAQVIEGLFAASEPQYSTGSVGACQSCSMPHATQTASYTRFRRAQAPGMIRSNVPQGHTWYASASIDACVADEIESEQITIPTGESRAFVLEPSRGCFATYYLGVIAEVQDADGNWIRRQGNINVGRFFRGQCTLDCRVHPVTGTKYLTDSCPVGCPFQAIIGRANGDSDDAFRVDITNTGTDEVRVQIVAHGMCLPGFSCVEAYESANDANGGGATTTVPTP